MGWKLLAVIALASTVLGAGCTTVTSSLPVPVSPPYSGFTEAGLLGAAVTQTHKFVYGCSTTGSTIWASVDPGPDEPGTAVQIMGVGVFSGYHAGLASIENVLPIGSYDLGDPFEADIATVGAGACFTVVVYAWSGSQSQAPTPGGVVSFTLNW